MQFFKSNNESFKRKFGKVVYPKPDPKGDRKFIIIVVLGLLTVLVQSGGRIQIDLDTVFFIAVFVVLSFLTLLLGPMHGRYLTTKGVYIRSSIFKQDIFIPWEKITKVEIIGKYQTIFFYNIEGTKYDFNYFRRGTRNQLFGPFMECLKQFRPDLDETYVENDYQDVFKQIKEDIKAKPWVVILGAIIIILILVVSAD